MSKDKLIKKRKMYLKPHWSNIEQFKTALKTAFKTP